VNVAPSVFRVVRLDPTTGGVQWSYRKGGGGNSGFATQLAVAADGAILAAGTGGTIATCTDAFVVALDRATGTPRWSETSDGPLATAECHPDCDETRDCPAVDDDAVNALGVDAVGGILVGGVLIGGTRRHATTVSFLRLLDH
jgi:outer membrane protein assembly factor BamB